MGGLEAMLPAYDPAMAAMSVSLGDKVAVVLALIALFVLGIAAKWTRPGE